MWILSDGDVEKQRQRVESNFRAAVAQERKASERFLDFANNRKAERSTRTPNSRTAVPAPVDYTNNDFVDVIRVWMAATTPPQPQPQAAPPQPPAPVLDVRPQGRAIIRGRKPLGS
jgi:hypothetical protein